MTKWKDVDKELPSKSGMFRCKIADFDELKYEENSSFNELFHNRNFLWSLKW